MDKNKQMLIAWAMLAALVFAALISHYGMAMRIVVALVWAGNLLTGGLAAGAALVLFTEGARRPRLKKMLRQFFTRCDRQAMPKYASWVLKLLVVMSLAFSGWLITLVCYLLAVVVFSVLRQQLAESATA